jgi:hypothetical protein
MLHAREDYDRIQDPEGSIPDDEPVFLIRSKDVVGALAVLEWARLNDQYGGRPEMSAAARAHADRMREWQANNATHFADAPDGTLRK